MPPPSSEHDLRRRARRRLIGAVALTLLAVIVLPLLLEDEPPPASSLAVKMPARVAQSAEATTAPSVSEAPVVRTPAAEPAPQPEAPKPESQKPAEKPLPADKPATKPADKPVAKPVEKPAEKPVVADKPVSATQEPAKPAVRDGYVVQLAALSDPAKADTLKGRAVLAGFPAYTDKVGALTRVRVGPYPSRDAASAASAKLAQNGLTGQIVSQ